jgi:predicted DNA-binding transcriptional regulator AlpA
MDEENPEFDHLSLNRAMLERVDGALLAVAGRLWEVARDTTPQAQQAAKTTWPVKEMRTSPLGCRLLLIADYASGGYAADPPQVERAMKQVLRTLYGDPLNEGYTVPEEFHKTDLGQLFDEAEWRIHGREGLMTPAEVYHELGISRTTLYNRVARKKLHPIYSSYGEIRVLRSEVEAWKAQRQRRKSSR